MQKPDVEQRTLQSFDGTPIAYQVAGQGPAVVLANGLGGTYTTWRHQYAFLARHYRVICWDYRGLFRSGRPPRLETLAVDQQVRDLELILEAEQVKRAVFMGWSMGVQFNFEYYRGHADQFAGLVVLNGTAGNPFQTAFSGHFVARQMLPVVNVGIRASAPLVHHVAPIVARWKGLVPVLQRLGMVAPSLDHEVFADLAQEYAGLDFEVYAETFRALGAHDASDLLHRIEVPTLIVSGTRDFFTPVATARALADAIPGARLVVLPGGTHYAAVEYPREVNEQLRVFLKEIGYGDLP
jgi:pimeloyl-ACP methyl ester carboxylesterase